MRADLNGAEQSAKERKTKTSGKTFTSKSKAKVLCQKLKATWSFLSWSGRGGPLKVLSWELHWRSCPCQEPKARAHILANLTQQVTGDSLTQVARRYYLCWRQSRVLWGTPLHCSTHLQLLKLPFKSLKWHSQQKREDLARPSVFKGVILCKAKLRKLHCMEICFLWICFYITTQNSAVFT